jgi:hypothetical protein
MSVFAMRALSSILKCLEFATARTRFDVFFQTVTPTSGEPNSHAQCRQRCDSWCTTDLSLLRPLHEGRMLAQTFISRIACHASFTLPTLFLSQPNDSLWRSYYLS